MVKDDASWLLVHCLNHRVKLASKDSFLNASFAEIDKLLTKPNYLDQRNLKIPRELKTAKALEKTVPKISCAVGT